MRALVEPDAQVMNAMTLDRHGPATLPRLRALPIPEPAPDQLLVRLHAAGVGHWDQREREGAFARRPGQRTRFPLVPGSEGAGVVVDAGSAVRGFREGDRVYGLVGHRNPKGGCHAEFAVLDAALARPIPPRLAFDQAAVLPVDGAVAHHALRDVLRLAPGEVLVLFGASGGIGHIALQFARLMGTRVLAIASGADGVQLCERLDADAVIDGRRGNVADAIARFTAGAPAAALLTAGGEVAAQVVAAMPSGSRIGWPHGVNVQPVAREDVLATGFGMRFDPEQLRAMHALAATGPFVPHVSQRFPLERLAQACMAIERHHLGRIAVLTA